MATDLTTWLTVGQAARRLGVSESLVRSLVDREKLSGARTAHGRLIDPTSVDDYLEEHDG